MLESEIKKLTAAVEANTAALIGGGVAPVTTAVPVAAAAPVTDDTKADPLAIVLPPADAEPVAEPEVPAADLKMITTAIVALCKAKGREAAAILMAEYGAQKVPDLKKCADKYDEILAKIIALTEAK